MHEQRPAEFLKGLSRFRIFLFSISVGLIAYVVFLAIYTNFIASDRPQVMTKEETIYYMKNQLAFNVTQAFKSFNYPLDTPKSDKVEISYSGEDKSVQIEYFLNTSDYETIQSSQSNYGEQIPYCYAYDLKLISKLLKPFSWSDRWSLPTENIFLKISKYREEETTDKYGNINTKQITLKPTTMGITMSDLRKINWNGGEINFKELSTLIPFSYSDVGSCNSNIGGRRLITYDY